MANLQELVKWAQVLRVVRAKAAEERAARELMADKEERDYRMKLRLSQS